MFISSHHYQENTWSSAYCFGIAKIISILSLLFVMFISYHYQENTWSSAYCFGIAKIISILSLLFVIMFISSHHYQENTWSFSDGFGIAKIISWAYYSLLCSFLLIIKKILDPPPIAVVSLKHSAKCRSLSKPFARQPMFYDNLIGWRCYVALCVPQRPKLLAHF